jgi:hypothetical protein
MTTEIVLEKIVLTEGGNVEVIRTPFDTLPHWAKKKLNPLYDHPNMCECVDCWHAMEIGRG